jgi:uncharacterized membrane protein
MLLVAAPMVGLLGPIPSGQERFSELWLLGPNHMAEGYPFNVRVGEAYSIFVGVGNHMGRSSYYHVSVKFRNGTQPLPDVSGSTPSPLPPLYEFRFLVADEATWESRVTFTILDASVHADSAFIGNVSINGVTFPVSSSAMWDSENTGFYFQLFFELWRYTDEYSSFRYHDRFVGLWLNMTG